MKVQLRFRRDYRSLPFVFRRLCGVSLLLSLAACAAAQDASPVPLPAPIGQITIIPSPTPSPTPTLPTPTATPLAAYTTASVNVRAGPGVSYPSLGLLAADRPIQVIGQDGSGGWYLILYPAGEGGQGWVAAIYVRIEAGVSPPPAFSATPTFSGPTARVSQRINVRSGPGLSFEVLGTLEAGTIVSLSGRNQNSTWLQILYPPGPGERGWISVAYVQIEDVGGVPILDEFGAPVPSTTAGPTSKPMTLTPTPGPARADDDSPANPSVRVAFLPGGTRQFLYRDDLSTPQGDGEDWIEFTPYAIAGGAARVALQLTCEGGGLLAVELQQDGDVVKEDFLACNRPPVFLDLKGGAPYLLHLYPQPAGSLIHIVYTLLVRNEF